MNQGGAVEHTIDSGELECSLLDGHAGAVPGDIRVGWLLAVEEVCFGECGPELSLLGLVRVSGFAAVGDAGFAFDVAKVIHFDDELVTDAGVAGVALGVQRQGLERMREEDAVPGVGAGLEALDTEALFGGDALLPPVALSRVTAGGAR